MGEQGQIPLLATNISVAPGWSSNALVIAAGPAARLVYRDVETNGWANFNCRHGAVVFWFKPDWDPISFVGGHDLLWLGDSGSNRWTLEITGGGGKYVHVAVSSNGVDQTLLNAECIFTSNRWQHFALNYTPTSSSFYLNGALVTNVAVGVTNWPPLSARTNGLGIGGSFGPAAPGQLDELETFNYPLSAAEIARKFQIVRSLDSNLDGVVDLLQDLALAAAVPFLGFPFVITGTMEAEQFDRGGEAVAYHCLGGNTVTNDYRASQFQIITNTTDRGAGFIVDNLRAGEWLKYTLDVRVAQTYAVEPRLAGLGTGGVFHVEFYTNGALAATTGPLTVLNTNWHDLAYRRVTLPAGTNVMKVVMDTNSASGAVCRLNYISVYPSWVEGVTNIVQTISVGTAPYTPWSTNTDFGSAKTNGFTLQFAIDSLTNGPGQGGVVLIPAGTYYVAQETVNETFPARRNAAALVAASNLAIQGSNTTLVAHNRATTILNVGILSNFYEKAVTNFSLRDVTFVGRPHIVATNDGSGGVGTFWETGALNILVVTTNITTNGVSYTTNSTDIGNLVVFGGQPSVASSVNLLFTNCSFRNPAVDALWAEPACINGVAVRNCQFVFREGTNGSFPHPRAITNPSLSTTVTNPFGGVGFFIRVCGDDAARNIVVQDCTYHGNPGMTAVNTNYFVDAGDGLFYTQQGGNSFVSRCAITNFGLEGVQFGAGPAAVAGNDFYTLVSLGATCALFAAPYWHTPTGNSNDQAFYLVGNTITGGRSGYNGAPTAYGTLGQYCTAHVGGNSMSLFPVFPLSLDAYDYPGQAVVGGNLYQAVVSGNTMAAGDRGIRWLNGCANAVVLKNDFSGAAMQGMSYDGTNGVAHHLHILRNVFNQGTGHHLRQPPDDPGSFLFDGNVFKHGASTVNPFFDPVATPVHIRH